MAAPAERQVAAEFVFDRSGEQGLVQAYRILLPSAGREPHRARRPMTASRYRGPTVKTQRRWPKTEQPRE